jgi:hypothetical protein
MLKSQFGIDAKIDKTFGNIPSVSFASKKVVSESVNEGKYYIGYNKGRGQGTGVFKDVFPTYKDAKKELEKIEKQRGGSYNQIAYYVADEKGNFVREAMLGEGRGVKAIQSDFNKTVAAIETELLHYKKTKGTPQEKKHIDNLKKLHPIKKKLEAELENAVSGLYKDVELKLDEEFNTPLPTTKSTGKTPTSMWIVRIAIVISDINGLHDINKRNQILKTIKNSIEKKRIAYDYDSTELNIPKMMDSFKYYPVTDKIIGIVPRFLFKRGYKINLSNSLIKVDLEKISKTIEIKEKINKK